MNIGKFGRRRTAPIYENAPPDHKPIFYGTRTLKPSNSMMERNTYNKPIIAQPPETPPVCIYMFLFISLNLFF